MQQQAWSHCSSLHSSSLAARYASHQRKKKRKQKHEIRIFTKSLQHNWQNMWRSKAIWAVHRRSAVTTSISYETRYRWRRHIYSTVLAQDFEGMLWYNWKSIVMNPKLAHYTMSMVTKVAWCFLVLIHCASIIHDGTGKATFSCSGLAELVAHQEINVFFFLAVTNSNYMIGRHASCHYQSAKHCEARTTPILLQSTR